MFIVGIFDLFPFGHLRGNWGDAFGGWGCGRTGSAQSLSFMERDDGIEVVALEVDLVSNNILGERKATEQLFLIPVDRRT